MTDVTFRRIHLHGEIGNPCVPELCETYEGRKDLRKIYPEGRRFRMGQIEEITAHHAQTPEIDMHAPCVRGNGDQK